MQNTAHLLSLKFVSIKQHCSG